MQLQITVPTSLNEITLICDNGAISSNFFESIIFTKPQSTSNLAIVFRLCISFSARSACFPSSANNSLKCTIKYLPCLCSMWQD